MVGVVKYICSVCNHVVESEEAPLTCDKCTDHTCMFEEYFDDVGSPA